MADEFAVGGFRLLGVAERLFEVAQQFPGLDGGRVGGQGVFQVLAGRIDFGLQQSDPRQTDQRRGVILIQGQDRGERVPRLFGPFLAEQRAAEQDAGGTAVVGFEVDQRQPFQQLGDPFVLAQFAPGAGHRQGDHRFVPAEIPRPFQFGQCRRGVGLFQQRPAQPPARLGVAGVLLQDVLEFDHAGGQVAVLFEGDGAFQVFGFGVAGLAAGGQQHDQQQTGQVT